MESWIRPAQLPFALHNHSENLEKSQNSKKKAEVCLANFERQTFERLRTFQYFFFK